MCIKFTTVNSGTLSNGGDHEFSLFYAILAFGEKGDFWGFSRLPAVWKRFVLLFFERVAKRGWEEEGGSVTRVTSNPSSKPFSADGPAKEALPGSLVSSCLHCYFYPSSLWSSFVYLQYLPTCNYLNRVLPNKLNVVHSKHNLERVVSNVQCFSVGPKVEIHHIRQSWSLCSSWSWSSRPPWRGGRLRLYGHNGDPIRTLSYQRPQTDRSSHLPFHDARLDDDDDWDEKQPHGHSSKPIYQHSLMVSIRAFPGSETTFMTH